MDGIRRPTTAVVLTVLVVVSLAPAAAITSGGGAGTAAAPIGADQPDAEVTVDRTGTSEVTVSIPKTENRTTLSNVFLEVERTDETSNPSVENLTDTYEATVGIAELTDDGSSEDLSAATVSVKRNETDDEPIGTDAVSLQYVAFDDPEAVYDSSDTLRVDAADVRGFDLGEPVSIDVDDRTVNATFENGSGTEHAIALDPATLREAGPFDDLVLKVAPAGSDAPDVSITEAPPAVNPRAVAETETALEYRDGDLTLRNPLLDVLQEESYDLRLETTSPDGTYVTTNARPFGGALVLPEAAITADLTVTLATDDGDALLEEWKGTPSTGSAVRFTVENETITGVDGDALALDDLASLSTLLFMAEDYNGGLERASLVETDGGYELAGGYSLEDLTENGSRMALFDGDERTIVGNLVKVENDREAGGGASENATDSNESEEDSGNVTDGGGGENGLLGGVLEDYPWPIAMVLPIGVAFFVSLIPVGLKRGRVVPRLSPSIPLLATVGLIGAAGGAGFDALLAYSMDELPPWLEWQGGKYLVVGSTFGGTFAMLWTLLFAVLGLFSGPTVQEPVTRSPDPVRVTVRVVDDDDRRIDGLEIEARPIDIEGDADPARRRVRDGSTSMRLLPGEWKLETAVGNRSAAKHIDTRRQRSRSVELEIPKPSVDVTVRDERDGDPVAGATVTLETDRETSDERTGDVGRLRRALSIDARSVSVSVDHPKYVAASNESQLAVDGATEFSFHLTPRTGDVRVSTEIDGVATEGLSVAVAPAEADKFRRRARTWTKATNDRGTVGENDVLVGDYRVELDVNGELRSLFRTETRAVTVEDGETARANVRATFEWSLSSTARERINALREEVDELADRAQRDVAFPRYYGSVVGELLELFERLPERGHLFATASHHPDEVVTELLNAAETAILRVKTAMTTKTNVDLFAACSDLSSDREAWSGTFDAADVLAAIDEPPSDGELSERIERTKDRIDDERGDLVEDGPTRDMWDATRDMFHEARRERDPLVAGTRAILVLALLDAVEEAYDHDALRERMEISVF